MTLVKASEKQTSVLNLSGVSKSYGEFKALDNVSLSIQSGEIFGLVGPDGAGKSTLIEIISGVTTADSGDIVFTGGGKKLGYVPQDLALYSDLTVSESIDYQASLLKLSSAGDEYRHFKEGTLEKMGLTRVSNRLTSKLSGGMRQKLALCCALVGTPRLILLDEPTTGLDPFARQEMWKVLNQLAADNVSILISTPILSESENCNRVALIHEGKIKLSGTIEELKASMTGYKRVLLRASISKKLDELSKKYENSSTIMSHRLGDHLEFVAEASELEGVLATIDTDIHAQDCEVTMENVFVHELSKEKDCIVKPLPFESWTSKVERIGSSNLAIDAKGIAKKFGDFEAVKNLDVSLTYGSILGLLGANGAGKTTCIKMLCGLSRPTAGEIIIGGRRQLRSSGTRKLIGYMSQKFTLYTKLTVLENLRFYATIYEVPYDKRKEQIDWVIESFGLEKFKDELVGNLPLGWKQCISFGAAVLHDPDILILDEPTAGVDPLSRRQIWKFILDYKSSGKAILVTTHYMEEAKYCDNLLLMHQGEQVASGSPLELKEKYSVDDEVSYLEKIFTRIIAQSKGGYCE